MKYLRLKIRRQRDDGTIYETTRMHKGINQTGFSDDLGDNAAAIQEYLNILQPIISDTITGADLVTEVALGASAAPTVEAGLVTDGWTDVDNLRLVNEYAGLGKSNLKETLNYPATSAAESAIVKYAERTAALATFDAEGVQGYYTGSTVSTAWQAS